MRWEDDHLVPIATKGLPTEVMGRRFALEEHPRLAAIVASSQPTVFNQDDPRPDPYDGLIKDAVSRVHSCMGCALRIDGQLIEIYPYPDGFSFLFEFDSFRNKA